MNIKVIKTFYRVNNCQDNPLPGYRQRFYREFSQAHPELNITEQNLVDRRSVIIRKGYLTQTEIADLKLQTQAEQQINEGEVEHTSIPHNIQTHEEETPNVDVVMELPPTNTIEIQDNAVREKLTSLIEFYRNTNPIDRPRIPTLRNIKTAASTLNKINDLLPEILHDTKDLNEVHLIIYCAAITSIELNGQKVPGADQRKIPGKPKGCNPPWRIRLTKDIDRLRAQVDILTEYLNNNRRPKITRKVHNITANARLNLNTANEQDLVILRDTLRQKYKAKGARLRRYNELTKRKTQNAQFNSSRKKFFRQLGENTTEEATSEITNAAEFTTYWKSIWSRPCSFNKTAAWIKEVEDKQEMVTTMELEGFTTNEVLTSIKKTSNWKTPGPDKIQNFWIKTFSSTHSALASCFTEALENPTVIPEHLMQGITYLLFKKGNAAEPKNYRPITCLSTVYKLFTSMINNKIYEHCETNNILEPEQKGCVRGALGCKHQLTIDAIVLRETQIKQRNLHVAYIDYTKAFDSTPHEWLLKSLNIYKISPKLIRTLECMMSKWRTTIQLNNSILGAVEIRRGIFQGDSLSPMWFCLALNPLSTIIKQSNLGFKLRVNRQNKISHLLFMDDLKLYAETENQLYSMLNTVSIFSNDINMSFGIDKCGIISASKGVVKASQEFQGIQGLEIGEVYKYLGIAQNLRIEHTKLKEQFAEKYKKRVTKILNTKLAGRNMITAINSWAVPVLTYSFGILKWSDTDLNALDRKTRTLMTKFRCLHTNSSVERLYLPRKRGGRGLVNIFELCKKQEENMWEKMIEIEDPLIRMAATADKGHTPLSLATPKQPNSIPTEQDHVNNWKIKTLHGKFPSLISEPWVDRVASLEWLTQGQLYPETEGFVMAVQDRVMRTRNYEKHILKEDVIDRCRKCNEYGESIEHIMSGCSFLANNAYLGRHNQVAKLIHRELALKYKLIREETTPPYYKYNPEPVLETREYILYWDRPVITDRTIDHNRPDIILIDKKEKTANIIDIAIPASHNVIKTEQEKQRKYEELAIQLKQIWHLKSTSTQPIVISAEGIISKHLEHNLWKLGVARRILGIAQKAVLLQTCHIIRKFLG